MQAEYKRDMSHNYLVLHAEKEIDTASYQVRMLVGNTIPSLLKCRFQGVDGSLMIYYEITSKQSIASLFEEKKLNYQDLQMVFGGFMQTMEEMSEYLLNPGRLVIRPEYMFVDARKREVHFCYLPDYEKDVRQQFRDLTEYILPRLDHEDPRAVMLGYGVYRRAMDDSFHLEYIKEELYRDSEEKQKKEPASGEASDNKGHFGEKARHEPEPEKKLPLEEVCRPDWSVDENLSDLREEGEPHRHAEKEKAVLWKRLAACTAGAVVLLGVFAAELLGYLPWLEIEWLLAVVLLLAGVGVLLFAVLKRGKQKRAPQMDWQQIDREKEKKFDKGYDKRESFSYSCGKRLEQDESIPPQSDSSEETIILSAEATEEPATLVSREPGELATIYLREDLTVVGKLKNAADAVIGLPTVSRIHAKIRRRNGEYYLSDLNSRNGTSVNGQMLLPDQEYCLQDQDQVDFAQARYVFVR